MNVRCGGMCLIVILILLSLNMVSLIHQQYYDYFVTSKKILILFEVYISCMLFILYTLM